MFYLAPQNGWKILTHHIKRPEYLDVFTTGIVKIGRNIARSELLLQFSPYSILFTQNALFTARLHNLAADLRDSSPRPHQKSRCFFEI